MPLPTQPFFFFYSGCNSISIKELKFYIQGKYLGPHYRKSLLRAGEDSGLSRRVKEVKGPRDLWRSRIRFQQKTFSVPPSSLSLPRGNSSPTPSLPSPPPRGQATLLLQTPLFTFSAPTFPKPPEGLGDRRMGGNPCSQCSSTENVWAAAKPDPRDPCPSKALTQSQNHRLKTYIDVTGSGNWFFTEGIIHAEGCLWHPKGFRLVLRYCQRSTKVSREKGVNSCKIPAQWAVAELDLVSYPVDWTPGASASPFSPSPSLVSSSPRRWFLSRAVRSLHAGAVPGPSEVPPTSHRLSGHPWRGLWGAGAQQLWGMHCLSFCVFCWTMGILIPDKASCSHRNIKSRVKVSQMGWAKSLTLFLCCKKPGGASASFSIASQESNSSPSLNCQSFVPGHRAK